MTLSSFNPHNDYLHSSSPKVCLNVVASEKVIFSHRWTAPEQFSNLLGGNKLSISIRHEGSSSPLIFPCYFTPFAFPPVVFLILARRIIPHHAEWWVSHTFSLRLHLTEAMKILFWTPVFISIYFVDGLSRYSFSYASNFFLKKKKSDAWGIKLIARDSVVKSNLFILWIASSKP